MNYPEFHLASFGWSNQAKQMLKIYCSASKWYHNHIKLYIVSERIACNNVSWSSASSCLWQHLSEQSLRIYT